MSQLETARHGQQPSVGGADDPSAPEPGPDCELALAVSVYRDEPDMHRLDIDPTGWAEIEGKVTPMEATALSRNRPWRYPHGRFPFADLRSGLGPASLAREPVAWLDIGP